MTSTHQNPPQDPETLLILISAARQMASSLAQWSLGAHEIAPWLPINKINKNLKCYLLTYALHNSITYFYALINKVTTAF